MWKLAAKFTFEYNKNGFLEHFVESFDISNKFTFCGLKIFWTKSFNIYGC